MNNFGQIIGIIDTVVSASSKELDTIHYDYTVFTALAANLTVTFDTNPYILPGLKHTLIIKDDGTRRTLNISASTINGIPLPTSASANAMIFEFQYLNVGGSLGWYCLYSKLIYKEFALSQINTDASASASNLVADIIFQENCVIDNNSIIIAAGVAPTGSSAIINFYNNAGTSLFSTAISIDAGEKTNLTAATPYALTSSPMSFAKGDRIYAKITQVGATVPGQNYTAYIKATL
jgi:hypothetical protein